MYSNTLSQLTSFKASIGSFPCYQNTVGISTGVMCFKFLLEKLKTNCSFIALSFREDFFCDIFPKLWWKPGNPTHFPPPPSVRWDIGLKTCCTKTHLYTFSSLASYFITIVKTRCVQKGFISFLRKELIISGSLVELPVAIFASRLLLSLKHNHRYLWEKYTNQRHFFNK